MQVGIKRCFFFFGGGGQYNGSAFIKDCRINDGVNDKDYTGENRFNILAVNR